MCRGGSGPMTDCMPWRIPARRFCLLIGARTFLSAEVSSVAQNGQCPRSNPGFIYEESKMTIAA